MRILMLAQFYAPVIGGEERHVQDLCSGLARRGHRVSLATLHVPGLPEFEIDEHGVRIYRLHSTTQRLDRIYSEPERRHAPPFPDPELVLGLQRVIQTEQPQVMHAHNWLLHSALPLKRWSRACLVVTLHDYSLICSTKRLIYDNAPCSGPERRKCLNCARGYYGLKGIPTTLANWASGRAERKAVDRFITVSQAVADYNGLVGKLPYRVIPNFLPDGPHPSRVAGDPRLAQLPEGDFLLFVGDINRYKGAHILLRAYEGLNDAPPLALIGHRCPDIPAEFPPGVRFLDSWPHELVLEAWRRCSFGLAPSTWREPFGIVAIEAMAAGKPVIASRTGGLTDIVADGESGLLVPPGDELALRHAMARLITDRELRLRMGESARRQAAKFQSGAILPCIEEVYRSVVRTAPAIERGVVLGREES